MLESVEAPDVDAWEIEKTIYELSLVDGNGKFCSKVGKKI